MDFWLAELIGSYWVTIGVAVVFGHLVAYLPVFCLGVAFRRWVGARQVRVLEESTCQRCGLPKSQTDLDLYYRYGFWHEHGTRFGAPGSAIYEHRKAEHTHG